MSVRDVVLQKLVVGFNFNGSATAFTPTNFYFLIPFREISSECWSFTSYYRWKKDVIFLRR